MRIATLTAVALIALCGISRAQWTPTEVAKLVASDGGAFDRFGTAVALSGNTAVVGAKGARAAYVYERASGSGPWIETAIITPTGLPGEFGAAAALSGDRLVVGAPSVGRAYVFERDQGGPGAWGQVAALVPVGAVPLSEFGGTVAIDGTTAVVGAYLDEAAGQTFAGSVYVFEQSQGGAGSWGQVARLTAVTPAANDSFGWSVSIAMDTIVVGGIFMDPPGKNDAGRAFLFERNQGGPEAWGQLAELLPSDLSKGDIFGAAVVLLGDSILVGAPGDNYPGMSNAGSAYVFERDLGGAGNWGEAAKLTASDVAAGDLFGQPVALSGGRAVVGASGHDSVVGLNVGSAYLFERGAGGAGPWAEVQEFTASDGLPSEQLGDSIGISGEVVIAGSPASSNGFGSVYTFGLSGVAYCTAGQSASGCQAQISATGAASASAGSGFTLSVTGVEGGKDGLFFFGANGKQSNTWGNGSSYQCVTPPVGRAGLLASQGTPGVCDGSFAQDLNARWAAKPGQNPGAGASVQAQLWYRDPQNTSNQSTSLSDAIEFTVGP